MIFLEEQINGSLVNCYMICKRRAWLCARQMHGDQENEYLSIKEIIELVSQEKPPKFVPIRYCKTCAYQDYCC